jgi:hypothetical protein
MGSSRALMASGSFAEDWPHSTNSIDSINTALFGDCGPYIDINMENQT